jgi:hypothetical protein
VKKFLAELEVSPLFTAMRDLSGLYGTLSALDDYSTDFYSIRVISPLYSHERFIRIIWYIEDF